jgi:hypothetical protein
MQKQIDLILNGKGGVGKSFFATNFVQYLKDNEIAHVAIDTDNENSTLKRFHPDARFINIANAQEIDGIFSAAETSSLVVVDCRAASTDVFLSYFEEVNVFDVLESTDTTLTLISPVNHELDSVEQLRTVAEALKRRCQYLIVKNEAFSEQFAIYDKSKTRRHLLEELHAQELTMPKLYDWLVASLNQVNLPITQALLHPSFSVMDRQRLKNWQRKFYDQIEMVHDVLLPQSGHDQNKIRKDNVNSRISGQ